MSIKQKISNNIYEIYPSTPAPTVDYDFYRQDFFTFTLIAFNPIDDPFDFSVYDRFRAQIRVGDPRNKKLEYMFEGDGDIMDISDEFVLGKTDVLQDEYDELHLVTDIGFDFIKPYPVVWVDIEGIVEYETSMTTTVEEHKTFIKIIIPVEPDVTR